MYRAFLVYKSKNVLVQRKASISAVQALFLSCTRKRASCTQAGSELYSDNQICKQNKHLFACVHACVALGKEHAGPNITASSSGVSGPALALADVIVDLCADVENYNAVDN